MSDEESPFEIAVVKNRVAAVKRFLKKGQKPDSDALFLAIENKASEVLKVLIRAGADLDALQHYWKFTPLTKALHVKNMPAFKVLLKAGASPDKNCAFAGRDAPLHSAVMSGQLEAVKLLIAAGANLEARDSNQATPLICAARFGPVEFTKVLLKAGADPQSVDVTDRNAYEYALVEKRAEAAEVLAPVSRIIPKKGIAALIEAVENQGMAAVEKCLATGVDVNARDKFGRSPLNIAIQLGSVAMVKRLIEAGININKLDPEGGSFLEGAAIGGHGEIAKILLHVGALPNPAGVQRHHPLDSVCAVEDIELAKLLISRGFRPRGSGALTLAAQMHAVETVRLFLSEGADVNELSMLGWTPLFSALFHASIRYTQTKVGTCSTLLSVGHASKVPEGGKLDEVVRLLIKHGAEVNRADEHGRTPLTYARSASVARILIEAGAKLDIRDKEGHPVSYWLKKNGVKGVSKSPDRSVKQPKRQAAPHVSKTKKRKRIGSA